MTRPKTELKKICVELRQQKRLSIRDICDVTGASKGSVSKWLRPYPLSPDEIAVRQSASAKSSAEKHKIASRVSAESTPVLVSLRRRYSPTTDQVGRAAELVVRARMALVGIEVFNPESDKAEVDLLCRRRGSAKLHKIQVRTATPSKRNGNSIVFIKKRDGRSDAVPLDSRDLDYLVGYDFDSDTAHVFALDEVVGHSAAISVTKDSVERWDKIV